MITSPPHRSKSRSSSPALDPPRRRSCNMPCHRQRRHRSSWLTADSAPVMDQSCAATSSANTLIGVGCPHHLVVRKPPYARRRGATACHFPRVPSLKAFGRPRCKPHRCESAGIRNPQQQRTHAAQQIQWYSIPRASDIAFGFQLAGSAAGGGERHEDLQEQLKPPNGGVFLGLNGIVIKSTEALTLRFSPTAINLGYKLVLQDCTPKSADNSVCG